MAEPQIGSHKSRITRLHRRDPNVILGQVDNHVPCKNLLSKRHWPRLRFEVRKAHPALDARHVKVKKPSVFDNLANVNLGKDLTVLARGGCIVVVGSRGEVQINPRLLMRTEGSILGLMAGTPEQYAQAHAAIGAGLRAGTLRPVVGQERPLAEAPRAHHEIIEGTAYGKIVLVP